MSANASSFLIPREQSLAFRHLRASVAPSPQSKLDSQGSRVFFWARNAIFRALAALKVPKNAIALLPAYLCKAAVEPFEAYGLRVEFYRITRGCRVDLHDLSSRLQPDTRVVLAAHYFGFPQDAAELRNLCTSHQVFLIEDCAHVLRGEIAGHALGSFGDASVFSYRKFLPMFDGAELYLRDSRGYPALPSLAASRFGSAAVRHVVGRGLEFSPSNMAAFARRAISLLRKSASPTTQRNTADAVSRALEVDSNSASFDAGVVDQPMTAASQWVLRHSDIDAVAAQRRQNFGQLHSLLANTSGITPLFSSLENGVCPWVYPVFLDGVPNAHLLMRAKGIPAVTWGGVRPGGISRSEYPDADFLYDNLIFLPIHQNLTQSQISLMAEIVKQVRAETWTAAPERIGVAS